MVHLSGMVNRVFTLSTSVFIAKQTLKWKCKDFNSQLFRSLHNMRTNMQSCRCDNIDLNERKNLANEKVMLNLFLTTIFPNFKHVRVLLSNKHKFNSSAKASIARQSQVVLTYNLPWLKQERKTPNT